jgi:hypothetical protein
MIPLPLPQPFLLRNELTAILAQQQQHGAAMMLSLPSGAIQTPSGSNMPLVRGGQAPGSGYARALTALYDNHTIIDTLVSLRSNQLVDAWSLIKKPEENDKRGQKREEEQRRESGVTTPVASLMICLKRPLSPPTIFDNTAASNNEKQNKKTTKNKWLSTFEELEEYKERYGDCIVPRGYAENPRLASWVAEQRKQFQLFIKGKPSSITHERIRCLERIGFAWNAQEAAWARQIQDLTRFRQENGHCHVPLNHKDYPRLGLWVKEQRRHYSLMRQGKKSHMNEERVEALTKVGFCWDTHEAIWMERFRELVEFKENHGTCVVPTGYSRNPKLGTWVHHQRRQYKRFKSGKSNCHITKERILALESEGFVWHPREMSCSVVSSDDDSSVSICSLKSFKDVTELDLRPMKRHRSSY